MLLLLGDVETEEWPGETDNAPFFSVPARNPKPQPEVESALFLAKTEAEMAGFSELFSSSSYYEDESLQQSGAVHKNIQEPPIDDPAS